MLGDWRSIPNLGCDLCDSALINSNITQYSLLFCNADLSVNVAASRSIDQVACLFPGTPRPDEKLTVLG